MWHNNDTEPHSAAGLLTLVLAPRCISVLGCYSKSDSEKREAETPQLAWPKSEREGKKRRAAATHHLPSLAHPHRPFCVPAVQSAEGEAGRREGGRERGRQPEGTPEEERRRDALSLAAGCPAIS